MSAKKHIFSKLKILKLHRDDDQLIKKALKKDRQAQKLLYEKHAPKMLSVCRYYVSNIEQAEEVMLNGFLKVYSNLHQFNFEGSFEGWIRRVMIRASIDYLRSKKNIEFPNDKIEHLDSQYNDHINSQIEVDEIQALIDALPDGYKIVFNMYAIEGFKHHEIAQALGISEGTSKSQLAKARRQLQQQIIELNQKRNVAN